MIINILFKIPFLIYLILLLIGMKRDTARISVCFIYQYTFLILSQMALGEFWWIVALIFFNLFALLLGIIKISKLKKRKKVMRIIRYQMIMFSKYYIFVYILLILMGGINV